MLTRYLVPIAVLVTLGVLAAFHWFSLKTFSGIVSDVPDGKTIQVYHQNKYHQIQLLGVDAPNVGEPFAREARDYILSLVGRKRVFVEVKATGPGELLLAEVFYVNGEEKLNLNRDLIRGGFARWDRAYSGDQHLEDLEHQAKQQQRGMWAPPTHRYASPATQPRVSQRIAAAPPPSARNSNNLPPSQPRAGGDGVYKWVDDKGTIHFSDSPLQPGAELIEATPITTYDLAGAQPQPTAIKEQLQTRAQTMPAQVRQVTYTEGQVNKGVFQTREGYRITADAKHFGDRLYFEGRVENGPPCRLLRLSGELANQRGERARLTATATDVGSGSRLYTSGPSATRQEKSAWEVVAVQATCSQR